MTKKVADKGTEPAANLIKWDGGKMGEVAARAAARKRKRIANLLIRGEKGKNARREGFVTYKCRLSLPRNPLMPLPIVRGLFEKGKNIEQKKKRREKERDRTLGENNPPKIKHK